MAVQPIRLFGDPVLRTPADPVVDFDKELRTLVADLFETMLDAPGTGLAAPQIGVGLRVFTYHVDDDEHGHLVNPELSFPDDEEQDGAGGLPVHPRAVLGLPRGTGTSSPAGCDMHGEPVTPGRLRPAGPLRAARDRPPRRRAVRRPARPGDPARRRWREIRAADWSGAGRRWSRSARTRPSGGRSEARLRRHPGRRAAVAARAAGFPARGRRGGHPARRAGRPRPARSPLAGRPAGRGRAASRCSRRPGRGSRTSWPGWPRSAPDCCPVVAYGALVPRAALDIPRHGWVNLHFSLLPAWRGAAPVQAAVLHGDEVTGAATFQLEEGLDTGPVYGVVTETVRPRDTAGRPARAAVRGRRRAAGRAPSTGSRTARSWPRAAAGRRGLRGAEDDRRGRPGATGPRRRSRVDRLVRACTPAPGRVDRVRRRTGSSSARCCRCRTGRRSRPGELLVEKRRVLVGTGDRPGRAGRGAAAGQAADAGAGLGPRRPPRRRRPPRPARGRAGVGEPA